MNRYVTICFRGDEVDHWTSWPTLDLAEACAEGVRLCDIDTRHGEVFDLKDNCLVIDADDFDEEWHGPKVATAMHAMSELTRFYQMAAQPADAHAPGDAAEPR